MLKRLLLAVVFVFSMAVAAFAAVNINTANQETLSSLPSIGPVKAAAIVEYRKDHGDFKTVDGLQSVKGIGAKTFEKLREQITVDK